MLRSKSLKAVVISAAVALTFTACASEPEDNGGGNNAPANDTNAEGNDGSTDTNEGGEGEGGGEASDEDVDPDNLVIATLSDANALDPHGSNDVPSSAVQHNIFETLLSQNEEAELEPLLATEWEATEENVWTLQLRDDVTFHDGSDFTADDVKATFDRVLDEDVASERAFLYEMVEEVVVVDDYTVEFHTEFPFAPFPSHLAHSGGAIMNEESIEEDYAAMEDGGQPGDYINENPIGTSYFKFEEWSPGSEIVLSRNDDYWGEPAGVEQVTFRVSPEGLTRIGELETGAADIIYPVSPSDTSRIEETEGVHMYEQESLSLAYIGFNMQKEPLDEPEVRQALSMAINKDDLIEGVYEGAATPAVGPIGEQVFGFSDEVEGLEYDPERAQELLAEAGYEDGFDTTIWTNDSDERIAVAELVQAQLSVIGVNAEIEVLEWGAYLDNTAAGEHDMFILGWVTVTADADYGMYALFHSEQQGAAGNRSFMDNEELDEILDEARREPDESTREDLYEQAMEILVEEAPMLYLYHTDYLVGVRDEVQGFWKHPNGIYQLHDVTIEQ